MDFLVVKNKSGEVEEVLSFNSIDDASAEKKKKRDEGHEGELILAFAKSLKSLLICYPEYRPKGHKFS